jgi:hypothetical protein
MAAHVDFDETDPKDDEFDDDGDPVVFRYSYSSCE